MLKVLTHDPPTWLGVSVSQMLLVFVASWIVRMKWSVDYFAVFSEFPV